MVQTNKTAEGSSESAGVGVGGLLREGGEAPRSTKGLLRGLESGSIFSRSPNEGRGRHFAKAYAYRLYTSAWVTPLVTMGTLTIKDHYHLDNTKAAFIQGGIELVIKPLTYALFEWGASHIRLGYRAGGAMPAGAAAAQDAK